MMTLVLQALLTGSVAPLGDDGAVSGIAKQPRQDAALLTPTGFVGDEQADLRVHGGPEKAVHHYPHDHYDWWRGAIGDAPALRAAGAFGENLSTMGLVEKDVAVGDVFELGAALIEVSQARQPCWKLNRRFGVADMARRVQRSGRAGWYYRVLRPGLVGTGDRLTRVERRAPEWTLDRLWRALYGAERSRAEWEAMAGLPWLAERWRSLARARLATGRIEDWRARLDGVTADVSG